MPSHVSSSSLPRQPGCSTSGRHLGHPTNAIKLPASGVGNIQLHQTASQTPGPRYSGSTKSQVVGFGGKQPHNPSFFRYANPQTNQTCARPPPTPVFGFGGTYYKYGGTQAHPTTHRVKPFFTFGSTEPTHPATAVQKPVFTFGGTKHHHPTTAGPTPVFTFGSTEPHHPKPAGQAPDFTFSGTEPHHPATVDNSSVISSINLPQPLYSLSRPSGIVTTHPSSVASQPTESIIVQAVDNRLAQASVLRLLGPTVSPIVSPENSPIKGPVLTPPPFLTPPPVFS